jgi:hypothetical protein
MISRSLKEMFTVPLQFCKPVSQDVLDSKVDSPLMDSRMSSNALPSSLINNVDSPERPHAPVAAFSFRDPKVRTPSFTQFLFGCDVELYKHQNTCGAHFYRTNVCRCLVRTGHFINLLGLTDDPVVVGLSAALIHWKLKLTDNATN